MERDEILREDFPTTRKGWDPAAVRAHLETLAASLPTSPVSLADNASEKVGTIVAAAEATAAQIEEEARTEADGTLGSARAEAEETLRSARERADEIVDAAKAEAKERVEQAQEAVADLVTQAEELRSRVGSLGEALAASVKSKAADVRSEITPPAPSPDPPAPDPAPPAPSPDPGPTVPEPDPEPPVPDPQPGPEVPEPPEPPAPEPDPPLPDRDPEPPQTPPAPGPPEPPAPDPEPPAAAETSTEDLIAQLKGGTPEQAANGTPAEADPVAEERPGADLGAARLVAMNLALEGRDRDAIVSELQQEFGDSDGLGELVDDVLSRVKL